MSWPRGGARAWLELMRLSNLPTVLSNTLVGLALGSRVSGVDWAQWIEPASSWRRLGGLMGEGWPVVVAGVLFYAGGMILNDVVDRHVDRQERPHRPLPSGRVNVVAAGGAAAVMLVVGVALAASLGAAPGVWAVGLAALIVAYNLLHQHTSGAAVLMGACRAALYLMAASVLASRSAALLREAAPLAALLGLYVVMLTIVARREARSSGDEAGGRRQLAWAMAILPLLGAAVVTPAGWAWFGASVAAAALVLWLIGAARHLDRQPPDIRAVVHAHLAGICLIDAYFLALMGMPAAVLAAWLCFGLTLAGHRRIMGT
ncbi:MAG TPA: UbiA family prenyltransferase [Phycisphaeraceae bacterium]